MGERGEFLPAGPTPCTVHDCPLEGVALVNGRRYCGGHAAELVDSAREAETAARNAEIKRLREGQTREQIVQRDIAFGAVPPPGVIGGPARLVLIENDDRGGVRSRPETVDAIGEVVQAYREEVRSAPSARLFRALSALDERWPS